MAVAGDFYIVTLQRAHLEWGTHRYTATRPQIYGEGYLPIPRADAISCRVYNSNYTGGRDVLGLNLFNCTSADGLLICQLKSQGAVAQGDVYAKQFSVNDDLQALGAWYHAVNAQIGDRVKVTWRTPIDIIIEKL